MTKKKVIKKRTKSERWAVYIVKCSDDSFYTGIAKNLKKRIEMHNSGKGAKYTRCRLPVTVIYKESAKSRVHALLREVDIKRLSRAKKEELVKKGKSKKKKSKIPDNPWKKIFRGRKGKKTKRG